MSEEKDYDIISEAEKIAKNCSYYFSDEILERIDFFACLFSGIQIVEEE
jgi:hypothetical protein